jgi:hypothetical protein
MPIFFFVAIKLLLIYTIFSVKDDQQRVTISNNEQLKMAANLY